MGAARKRSKEGKKEEEGRAGGGERHRKTETEGDKGVKETQEEKPDARSCRDNSWAK